MSHRQLYNLLVILPLVAAVAFGVGVWQNGSQWPGQSFLKTDFSLSGFLGAQSAQAQTPGCTEPVKANAGEGRIYFSQCLQEFRMSKNAGDWESLGGSLWKNFTAPMNPNDIYNTNPGTVYIAKDTVFGVKNWGLNGSTPALASLIAGQNLIYGVIVDPNSIAGPLTASSADANLVSLNTANWNSIDNNYNYDQQFVITSGGIAKAKSFCTLQSDGSCQDLASASYWQKIDGERTVNTSTVFYTSLTPADNSWDIIAGSRGLIMAPKICVPDDSEENCINSFSDIKASTSFWTHIDTNNIYSDLINRNKSSSTEAGNIIVARDLKVVKDINVVGFNPIYTTSLPLTAEALNIVGVSVAKNITPATDNHIDSSTALTLLTWEKDYISTSTDGAKTWDTKKITPVNVGLPKRNLRKGCVSPDGNFAVIPSYITLYYSTDGLNTWNSKSMEFSPQDPVCYNDKVFLGSSSEIYTFDKVNVTKVATIGSGLTKFWVSNDQQTIIATRRISNSFITKCSKSGASYLCDIPFDPDPTNTRMLVSGITGVPDGSLLIAAGDSNSYFISTNKFETNYYYKPINSQSIIADGSLFIRPDKKQFIITSGGGSGEGRYEINNWNGSNVSETNQVKMTVGASWRSVDGNNKFVVMVGNGGNIARAEILNTDHLLNKDSWGVTQLALTNLNATWGDSAKFVAVGNNGSIGVAQVAGSALNTWSMVATGETGQPPTIDYTAVGGSGSNIVAVGLGSSGAYSTNGGDTWGIATGLASKNYGVWVNGTTAWAVGSQIYKSIDSGAIFTSIGQLGDYRAVHGLGSIVVAVGGGGKINASVNNGTNWHSVTGNASTYYGVTVIENTNTNPTTCTAKAVAVGEVNIVDIITISSNCTTITGINISSQTPTSLPSYWVNGKAISGTKDLLYVVGASGKIMFSSSGGFMWENFEKTTVDPTLNGVSVSGNLMMAVGNNNTVLFVDSSDKRGGNITAVGNLIVPGNSWGGSDGGSANVNPTTGLIENISATNSSCPSGEFMVGIKKDGLGLITGIYCQKL